MFYNTKSKSDTFAFALGGAALVGAFVPVPVIVSDRINKAWDERLSAPQDDATCARKGARTSSGLLSSLLPRQAT